MNTIIKQKNYQDDEIYALLFVDKYVKSAAFPIGIPLSSASLMHGNQ